VWTVGWGVGALAVVAVVLAFEVGLSMASEVDLPWPTGLLTVAAGIAAAAAVGWLPRLAYDRWRYELAETTLELRRGVSVHTTTAIPYFRVQHIDITRSPVERALGLSQLVVRTAAASTDATLPGIAAEDADTLRDLILARTASGDAL